MKKYLILGVLIMSVLFTIPLSAAENVKIKLPDGLYMYDTWIKKLPEGNVGVNFQKIFVARNNIIYSSQEALSIFGVSKLNKLFTENRKYKILFGSEKIGEIYNVKIGKYKNKLNWNYKKKLLVENIKEGPAYYWPEIMFPGPLTSATKCLAVPEEYKEVKKNIYTAIPQEEVDKIAKLAKEKLLPLLINRKGFAKYKIREMELFKENLWILDKISYQNHELYIGEYQYGFKGAETSYHFHIIFSATKDNMHIVTTNYEEGDLVAGYMKTYGMLDVDGCGNDELLIEKEAPREDETTIWLEIHKQKPDGNWMIIKVVKTKRIL